MEGCLIDATVRAMQRLGCTDRTEKLTAIVKIVALMVCMGDCAGSFAAEGDSLFDSLDDISKLDIILAATNSGL